MTLVSQVVHPNSMNFRNQRRVYVLRAVHKLAFNKIRAKVWTLKRKRPSEWQCREVFKGFNLTLGFRKYSYSKCGRKPWKLSREVEKFLLRTLLRLRRSSLCTSSTLQRELLKGKGVELECSTIRKVLTRNGYRWLPRAQKPKYSREDKQARLAFAEEVLAKTQDQLCKEVAMSMDGVVLSVPPVDPVERENYIRCGETHMWRKASEAAKPELSAGDEYGKKQIPHARAVPMWGGIGDNGCGIVTFHAFKKMNQHEWADAVEDGSVVKACKEASGRSRGPWCLLCDNESFLQAPASRVAHARARIELWQIPPRSPDLNPVEQFWNWVRGRLRAMDLADLKAKRAPVGKSALKERVRRLLRTERAKGIAKRTFRKLRERCVMVKANKGAGIRG